ncbi:MarR family transcriptional regulator [Myxococcota bacterium]|nr:MarR family transcriptional regulator [Myxococcota bacterium]
MATKKTETKSTKSGAAKAAKNGGERAPKAPKNGGAKGARAAKNGGAKVPVAADEVAWLDDGGDPKLGKVLDFMRLLWGVDHSLQSASKRMAQRLGVTGLQRLVIRIVGRFPGISAGSLAEILKVHPSTLTGVFDKLAERGAIKRVADPADARRVRLELTAKGRGIDDLRAGTVEASIRRALGGVTEDELAAAERVLEALVRELDES